LKQNAVVIGLGNPLRGDDAAGFVVAERLRKLAGASLRVIAESRGGVGLLDRWTAEDNVVVVDSVQSASRPGRVFRFDGLRESIPERLFRRSTHAVGVYEALELARSIGRLPRRLVVYGIEGRSFEPGAQLSPDVEASVEEVVGLVLRECCAQNAV
jgi:hydrogenase maturation protease